MSPENEFGLMYPELLAKLAEGDPLTVIHLADDWQPIETYRPSTDYVWIKYCDAALNPGKLAVASRGWHRNSFWYSIGGLPLSITRTRGSRSTGPATATAARISIGSGPTRSRGAVRRIRNTTSALPMSG
jgi:hypothetical protein